jgi:16S rRNA processing protein RimM
MDKLATGTIKKTYGVNGELTVNALSGENGHLLKLKYVFIENNGVFLKYAIERIDEQGQNLLLKLEGVNTKEEGQKFVGKSIWVNREDACPVEENEYYFADLYRCTVFMENDMVGKVKGIYPGGSVDIIEVEKMDGNITMVPLSKRFVKEIDISHEKIILTKEFVDL